MERHRLGQVESLRRPWLVSVGYERQVPRCKTENSRRQVELDPTTLAMLSSWRDWQEASTAWIGSRVPEWLFPGEDGGTTHPHAFSQAFERIVRRAGLPATRLHDLRHPTPACSSRTVYRSKSSVSDSATPKASFTMDTYQHVMPGMQADAARTYERIVAAPTPSLRRQSASTGTRR